MKYLRLFIIIFISLSSMSPIEKRLAYDRYTLSDNYRYGNTYRQFQWDRISTELERIDSITSSCGKLAMLFNYKNQRGIAATVINSTRNEYNSISDRRGVSRHQAIPLYSTNSFPKPDIYALDGSLVSIKEQGKEICTIIHPDLDGEWFTLNKFVIPLSTKRVNKVIVVDIVNQNIVTLERKSDRWVALSMNPATTGAYKPPYQKATPEGLFVIYDKKRKMHFLKDGTSKLGGYAPYASRFSGGGYIHGVPVNFPSTDEIEYSPTLGSVPRSHMCIRNVTSHAKFIYEWGQGAILLVI